MENLKDIIKSELLQFSKKFTGLKVVYAYDMRSHFHIIELHEGEYSSNKEYFTAKVALRRTINNLSKTFDQDVLLTKNCKHHDMSNVIYVYQFQEESIWNKIHKIEGYQTSPTFTYDYSEQGSYQNENQCSYSLCA